ncbi:MAG: response regulator [Acidobacteriia bacterium]|nr:response regulator [Terriglobia bacterium]
MPSSKSKRILVLDNSEEVLARLETLLAGAGYETLATWSGLEALRQMEAGSFDALLLEDYVADLHTGDLLRRVSQLAHRPRIIVMRITPKPGNLRRYENFGVSAFVEKHRLEGIPRVLAACWTRQSGPESAA